MQLLGLVLMPAGVVELAGHMLSSDAGMAEHSAVAAG